MTKPSDLFFKLPITRIKTIVNEMYFLYGFKLIYMMKLLVLHVASRIMDICMNIGNKRWQGLTSFYGNITNPVDGLVSNSWPGQTVDYSYALL